MNLANTNFTFKLPWTFIAFSLGCSALFVSMFTSSSLLIYFFYISWRIMRTLVRLDSPFLTDLLNRFAKFRSVLMYPMRHSQCFNQWIRIIKYFFHTCCSKLELNKTKITNGIKNVYKRIRSTIKLLNPEYFVIRILYLGSITKIFTNVVLYHPQKSSYYLLGYEGTFTCCLHEYTRGNG